MSAKKSTLALAVAGVLALAVVAYGFWRASRPAPEQFQGYMEAQETDIAAKISARVAEVAVKEGDRVARGSLLVRLDSPEVAAKMAQAQGRWRRRRRSRPRPTAAPARKRSRWRN